MTDKNKGNTVQPPSPVVPPTNQESAVSPVSSLNNNMETMVSLMRDFIAQQKNTTSAVKKISGDVQTAVT
jgi:hypothetical protein